MLKRPKGDPNPTPQYVESFKAENATEPKLARAARLLKGLHARMAETCPATGRVPGIRGFVGTRFGKPAPTVEVGFVNVPHEQDHAPSYLLSATPHLQVYGRIFKNVELRVLEDEQPPNLEVIRIPERGTMSQLLEDQALTKTGKQLADNISMLAGGVMNTAEGEFDVLVVAKKEVKKKLMKSIDRSRVTYDHFGNLQGKNHYKTAKLEVIAGIRVPLPIDLKTRAETILGAAIDIGDPDFWPKRPFIETPGNGGEPRVMYDYTHRDPTMRALLRAILHAEIVQADRLRARRRPDEELTLVLINTVDLSAYGVVIDEHLVLNPNRHWYAAMAERGVVPDLDHPKLGSSLNALIYGALPAVFANIKQVNNVRNRSSSPNGEHGFPLPQAMWVWPKGGRGREPVWVDAPNKKAAAEPLEEVFPDAVEIKRRNQKRERRRHGSG